MKLYISILSLLLVTCTQSKDVIVFEYPIENLIMKIESISPDGRYMIVNVYQNLKYEIDTVRKTCVLPPIKNQIVVDMKNLDWWQLWKSPFLHDNIYVYQTRNFAWANDSKTALCCVGLGLYPNDTLKNFPIYLYNFNTRKYHNMTVPWLGATHFRIPLFAKHPHEIIFYSPGLLVDTLNLSSIAIGSVVRWDTLSKKIVEIRKGVDIAFIDNMMLHDTTYFLLSFDGVLKYYINLSGRVQYLLPDIRIANGIRKIDSKIVFVGNSTTQTEKTCLYVYDIAKKELEWILNTIPQDVFYADMNKNNWFLLWTGLVGDEHIYIYSEKGHRLISFDGYTPYWLVDSDTVIYSEGDQLVKAWLDKDQKLHKKIVLRHIEK